MAALFLDFREKLLKTLQGQLETARDIREQEYDDLVAEAKKQGVPVFQNDTNENTPAEITW